MRLCLLILIIVFFHGRPCAQYLFNTLQTKDGLSSNTITCILKDSDGYLWLGANNGLNRFDGSSVKVYNWANKNYPLDHSESISDIVELTPGMFLIGTRNDLIRFSSYNRQFENVIYKPGVKDKNKSLEVYDMVTDQHQRAWIITSQGLWMYDCDTVYRAGQLFKSIQDLEDTYLFSGIMVLDTLRKGIWLTTNQGLYLVNYLTGDITTHEMNPQQIPVFRNKSVYTIAIHPLNGDIWWSDEQNLLAHYSVGDKKVQSYNHLIESYGYLPGKLTFVDSKGRVWYSTWTGKCLVLDPSGDIILLTGNSTDVSTDDYGLQSAYLDGVIEDKNGELWLATLSGAAQLSGSNVIHKFIDLPFENAVINSFSRMEDGRMLISTNAGLIIYNERQQDFRMYKPGSEESGLNRVYVAVQVGKEWWCGSGGGIQIFDPVSKTFRQQNLHPYTDEIRRRSVTVMLKDSRGFIWFTTWAGYVYRYDTVSETCIRFDGSIPSNGDIGLGNSMALTEDSYGRIWVGYADKGIRVYDHSKGRFEKITRNEPLDASVINNITESAQHHMWISSWGNGLFKVNLDGEVIQHMTTQHGLMSNYTSSVSIDATERIWLGTPESIHYFHPGAKLASKINFHMGFALGEDWVSMLLDSQFNYLSLKDRILVIDHTLLDQQKVTDLPLISAIRVFENELPFSPLAPDVHLDYDQNFFTIEFSSPFHRQFPSLQYAYILEGFNRDWVNSGRGLSASFTNVPPGEYVFRLKSSDQNGIFHDGNRHFAVVIQPPFWQTRLFYFICLCISALILYQVFRIFRLRREKKKSDQIIDYFANSVYSENSVNEICWDIARNCISQLGFEDCVVYLLDADRDVLIQKAAFGPKNPRGNEIVNPIEIPVGQGIVGTVAKEGHALLIADTTKDARYIPDDIVRFSELAVPILHEQKVIGVIDSEHPQKSFFTDEHLKTLATIASISSFKIAEAQAHMLSRASAIKLLEVNTLFAESQLKALRAQMNPHFVFNCLNSIQECIVMKKYGEASAYLNKFAKLFRLVLNNSGKLLITIDEEVEILTLYLELELMRFEHSFQYNVHIDPGIESDVILMPSMFLQPIVENALWHGLMHKNGERKLDISFQKISDDIFSCSIADNGIGRKKSTELKKQKIFTHSYESKGMKMNMERLEVFRHQGFHATLRFVDKEDPDGASLGTTVIAEFSNNFIYK